MSPYAGALAAAQQLVIAIERAADGRGGEAAIQAAFEEVRGMMPQATAAIPPKEA